MKTTTKGHGKAQGFEAAGHQSAEAVQGGNGLAQAGVTKVPATLRQPLPKKPLAEDELAALTEEPVVGDSLAEQILLVQAEPEVMSDAPLQLAAAEGTASESASGAGGVASGVAAGGTAMSVGTMAAIGVAVVGVAVAGGGDSSSSDDDTAPRGSVVATQGLVIDGYVRDATVFRDLNDNGVRDADEPQTSTNAEGAFRLNGSGGVIIAYGGVDVTTGAELPAGFMMKGVAMSGADVAVVTPLTTLVVELARAQSTDPAHLTTAELEDAQLIIQSNLGISPVGGILTYNPITANDGNGDAYIAQGQAVLTLINTLVAASDGAITPADIVAAITEQLGSGAVNYTDPADVASLIAAVDTSSSIGNASAVADTVAALVGNVVSVVTSEGYDSAEAITAFNEANGEITQLLVAVIAGHTLEAGVLEGVTLTYGAATVLALGDAAIAPALTAGATLALSDSGNNLDAAHIPLAVLLSDLGIADAAITVTGAPNLSQLANIDSLTTADLVYSAVADTASALTTNADGYVTGAVNVSVIDVASIEQLAAVDGYTTGSLSYTTIADTVDQLIVAAEVSPYVVPGVDVAVIGTATVAQLAALDGANGPAAVSAEGIIDTVAELLASGYVSSGTDVTVIDAASIAQLGALDAANGNGDLVYGAIIDSAEHLVSAGSASAYIVAGTDVTVSSAANISQLAAISAANGGGALNYTVISDTAANLSADAGNFVSDDVAVVITTAATLAQLAMIDGYTSGEMTYTIIADEANNLIANADGYVNEAVATLIVTDAVAVAQVEAVLALPANGNIEFVAGVSDSGSNIAAGIATIAAAGITAVNADDDTVVLNTTQAAVALTAGISFAADDAITVSGSSAELLALDLSAVGGLGGSGITFDSNDDLMVMSAEQAGYLINVGVAFDSGDTISISGPGTELAMLDLGSLAALGGAPGIVLDASDDAVTLSNAQAAAIIAAGARFAGSDFLTITVADGEVANAISDYTVANLGGVGIVLDGDGTVSLSNAQAAVIAADSDRQFGGDDVLTISVTDGEVANAIDNYIGVRIGGAATVLDVSDNTVTVSCVQVEQMLTYGVAFAADNAITITGTGIGGSPELQGLDLAALEAVGGNGSLTFAPTTDLVLTVAQAAAWQEAGVTVSCPDHAVAIYGSGTELATLDLAALTTLFSATGALSLNQSDDAITLSHAQAAGIIAAGAWLSNAGGTGELTITGIADGVIDAAITSFVSPDLYTGYTSVILSGDGSVTLTSTQAAAMAFDAVRQFSGSDVLTISLADGEIDDAISNYTSANLGGASITLDGDGSISLSNAQAAVIAADGDRRFSADDVLSISLADAEVDAAIAAYTPASLGGASIVLDADSSVTLTAAQAAHMLENGMAFAVDDAITITGTGAELTSLDLASLPALGGNGSLTLHASSTLYLLTEEASALLDMGVVVRTDDSNLIINFNSTELAALDLANLGSLAEVGTNIYLYQMDNSDVALSYAQANDIISSGAGLLRSGGGMPVIVSGIGDGDLDAAISNLTAANLGFGVGAVTLSGDGSLSLTNTQAAAIAADSARQFAASDVLTITLADGEVADAVANYTAANLGGAFITLDMADNSVTLTAAQAAQLLSNNVGFHAGDAITITGTGSELLALNLGSLAALGGNGTLTFDPSTMVNMTVAQAGAVMNAAVVAGLVFTADSGLVISGSGAELATLDLLHIADLGAGGNSTTLLVTDDAMTLSYGEAAAIIAAPHTALQYSFGLPIQLTVTGIADGNIAAAIADLTTSNTALGTGIQSITLTGDGSVSLSAAEADAIAGDAAREFAASDVLTVAVSDAGVATAIANYTTAKLGGAAIVLDGDGSVTLTLAQADAMHADGAQSWSAADHITIAYDFGDIDFADLVFSDYGTAALGGASVTFDVWDNQISLTYTQVQTVLVEGITFGSDDSLTITGSGAELLSLDLAAVGGLCDSIFFHASTVVDMTAEQAAALMAAGVVVSSETHIVSVSGTGAELAALDLANIADLGGFGTHLYLEHTDTSIALTHAQAAGIVAAGATLLNGAGTGELTISGIADADLASALSDFTLANLGSGYASIALGGDGTLSLSAAQASTIATDAVRQFSGSDVLTVSLVGVDVADAIGNYTTAALGGAAIVLDGNGVVGLTNAQAAAIAADGSRSFAADDAISVTLLNDEVANAVTSYTTANLGGDFIVLDGIGELTLTVAQADAIAADAVRIFADDVLHINLTAGEVGNAIATYSALNLGGSARVLNVDSDAVTLTAVQVLMAEANGISFDASDAISVTDASAAVAYDFAGLSADSSQITVNYATGGVLALGTSLGSASLVAAKDVELTLSALQADGRTISGEGDVVVFGVSSAALDLSGIAVSGVMHTTISGSVQLDASTVLGDFDVTVGAGSSLQLSAVQADGRSISGAGDAVITDLGSDPVDLRGIAVSGSMTATVSSYTSLDYYTELGDVLVTVSSGVKLMISGYTADGARIDGDGNIDIVGVSALTQYDFSLITSGTGTVKAFVTSGGTLNSATQLGETELVVASGQTLTLTAAQADGRVISGDGNVVVTDLGSSEVDLSGIAVNGTQTVQVNSSTTLHANTELGDCTVVVEAGNTLTLDAAQATAQVVTGTGNVIVTGVSDVTDLSALDVGGTVTATITGHTNLLPGATLNVADVDVFDIEAGGKLSLTQVVSEVANLGAVTGTGELSVYGSIVPDSIDMSGVDVSGFGGTVSINGYLDDDLIRGTQHADTIAGGDGSDNFVFHIGDSASVDAVAKVAGSAVALANGVDVISDFTFEADVEEDQIDLTGVAGLAGGNVYQGVSDDPWGIAEGDIYVVKGSALNGLTISDAVVLVNSTGGETTGWADFEMAIYVVGGASVDWSSSCFDLPTA